MYDIIFEAETALGKWFDIGLMIAIAASVLVVMLDSIQSLQGTYGALFYGLEWGFTLLFTIEYALRIWVLRKPAHYIFSFFGLIDFLAILPTYLSLLLPGAQYLLVIRLLRVLRVFRVLKLVRFVDESKLLVDSLKQSARKVFVFIFSVFLLVVILGALIYSIEGGSNGFTSIPKSIYWAIVTLTTVGYGDIAPKTNTGQVFAAMIMLLGYGIIAVPAGIVTAELAKHRPDMLTTEVCPHCTKEGHERDAIFCKFCGYQLNKETI